MTSVEDDLMSNGAGSLAHRLESIQGNFRAIGIGNVSDNSGGTFTINGLSNDAPQNSFGTLTVNNVTVPDYLGRPFLGLRLETNQRIGTLKGDGIINLNGYTIPAQRP